VNELNHFSVPFLILMYWLDHVVKLEITWLFGICSFII